MAADGPGSRCTLYAYHWEGGDPEDGDLLITEAGSCYQIVHVRKPKDGSKLKFYLLCERLPENVAELGQPGVHLWRWGPRKKGATA